MSGRGPSRRLLRRGGMSGVGGEGDMPTALPKRCE